MPAKHSHPKRLRLSQTAPHCSGYLSWQWQAQDMDHESPVGFPGLLSLATLRFVPLVCLSALPLLVRGLAAIARPRTATIPGLPMQALTPRLNPSITPMTDPYPSRIDLPTSSRSLCMLSPLLPRAEWRRWHEVGVAAAVTAPKADRQPRPSSQ